jgi:hypothetical protein
MRPVYVTDGHIVETLDYLQEAGRRQSECVVLWLGRQEADGIAVMQVYRPDQLARADFFRIPPASMRSLLATLGTQDLFIAAQVHSHPFEAFHSKADDAWAIVRHVDALSLVLPDFAIKTSSATFFVHVKIFQLTTLNLWCSLDHSEAQQWLRIR